MGQRLEECHWVLNNVHCLGMVIALMLLFVGLPLQPVCISHRLDFKVCVCVCVQGLLSKSVLMQHLLLCWVF